MDGLLNADNKRVKGLRSCRVKMIKSKSKSKRHPCNQCTAHSLHYQDWFSRKRRFCTPSQSFFRSFVRSTCQGLMSAIIQPNANALLLRRFYSPTKPNLSFLVDRWRVTLLPRKSDRDQKSARVRQVRTPESLDPTSQSSLCSAGEPEKEEKMRREKMT